MKTSQIYVLFSSGGFGHKAETIDQCSQVHAVHEGGLKDSYLPQNPYWADGLWKNADSLTLKGNPEEPKCGFSKQTVGIFKDLEADYGTFDILNDDEVGFPLALLDHQWMKDNSLQVRQGLKTFSNWPTYPQLYIDGLYLFSFIKL